MPSVARKKANAAFASVSVAEATVAEVESLHAVVVQYDADARRVSATLAVAGGYRPQVKDRVVVAAGPNDRSYVIGVVHALRAVATAVTTSDGTTVALTGAQGADVLEVRDREGRLLFEHRAGERKSVVHAPQGDIELRADDGNIDLVASQKVRIHAAQGVQLTSERTVGMAVTADDRAVSSVKLDARSASVSTPHMRARAERADVSVDDGRMTAKRWSTAIERVHQVVGVMESRASRIIEHAKNVYREVEELSQTRAGRMRLVADTTFHLLGKRAFLKATEDVNIKGERIYLA